MKVVLVDDTKVVDFKFVSANIKERLIFCFDIYMYYMYIVCLCVVNYNIVSVNLSFWGGGQRGL